MYNAVVAKSPGKVFNYFRTLKTIPVALTQVELETHIPGVSYCAAKKD